MNVHIINLLILASIAVMSFNSGCNGSNTAKDTIRTRKVIYNKELASQLGADEYGMHKYVIAFLKAGPERGQDSLTVASLQRSHLANIGRLAEEGKLVLAGPFLDNGQLRGIYIFDVETVQEARKLTETDPAILAGRLTMELHPWYGSAALKQVNQIHNTIAKTKP